MRKDRVRPDRTHQIFDGGPERTHGRPRRGRRWRAL